MAGCPLLHFRDDFVGDPRNRLLRHRGALQPDGHRRAGRAGSVPLVFAVYADTATSAGLGATTFGAGVGYVQALVAEAIGAFILVTAVFALAVAPNAPKGMAGLGIGLALATQIMVFGPLTGASVNLARTLGPDAVLSLAGESAVWSQLFAYVAGPLVGGLAAAFLCDYLAARRSAVETRV